MLRRNAVSGLLDETQGTLARADLATLPLQLWPYAPLAERAWQLRHNVTDGDAVYVSLPEMLGAPMITLDSRIAGAGVECSILAYDPAEN